MSDKKSAVGGSSRTTIVQSQKTITVDRGYNLQVHNDRMVGVTIDRNGGYATAGFETKKRVCLQNSTDKYAAYDILSKTFK
ncbi:hypothetical protein HA402_011291 [Bradysia odoriphaga]|nr:hypothetical protein HA402_011291 [Bradysia odoriphaga]